MFLNLLSMIFFGFFLQLQYTFKMAYEIEKKAWLSSLSDMEKKVASFMSFIKEDMKKDTYYIHSSSAHIDFMKDSIFRIREDNSGVFINYKQREFSGKTEINQETEFPVINPGELEKLFFYMGYKILVKKYKHSKIYGYKNAAVELNVIEDLGNFIEVEVIAENEGEKDAAISTINEIFSLLEIPEKDIENRYYIDLLLAKTHTQKVLPGDKKTNSH